MIHFIRTSSFMVGSGALILIGASCAEAPDQGSIEPRAVRSVAAKQSEQPTVTTPENPFAYFSYSASASIDGTDFSSCMKSRLDVSSATEGDRLSGTLEITNDCASTLAVLTAPIETRERLTAETRLPFEGGGINQVYAIAYFFRRELGFTSKGTFLGDGGYSVMTLPEYVLVPPNSAVKVKVSSGAPLNLAVGSYGLALFTIVTPTFEKNVGAKAEEEIIDFQNSIARFAESRTHSAELRLPPAAFRVAPVAYFEVTLRQ